MKCRVCGQPLSPWMIFENMPAMAQRLSDTPEQHAVTLHLCQCDGCGLVQLDNDPVWYWNKPVRVEIDEMKGRLEALTKNVDFTSLHILEHQPRPNKYLKQFSGRGIIEVPNFDMIYAKRMFAEIMLDHLMYFTEDTLRFTLQYNGFEVIEIRSAWDDYILSALVKRRKPLDSRWSKWQQEILMYELCNYIAKYKRVAIYGASHQAFAYIAKLHPNISFVVDDAPFKQGKYTPVGGLLIHRPEHLHNADAVIIMGGGYSDIIAKKLDFDGGVAIMRDWGVEVMK